MGQDLLSSLQNSSHVKDSQWFQERKALSMGPINKPPNLDIVPSNCSVLCLGVLRYTPWALSVGI